MPPLAPYGNETAIKFGRILQFQKTSIPPPQESQWKLQGEGEWQKESKKYGAKLEFSERGGGGGANQKTLRVGVLFSGAT